jgi:hypothetical protein
MFAGSVAGGLGIRGPRYLVLGATGRAGSRHQSKLTNSSSGRVGPAQQPSSQRVRCQCDNKRRRWQRHLSDDSACAATMEHHSRTAEAALHRINRSCHHGFRIDSVTRWRRVQTDTQCKQWQHVPCWFSGIAGACPQQQQQQLSP